MINRVAAAPISWGICEAPGWGLQMSPERVLGEMRELGITATELGALGWLPTEPTALRDVLAQYELTLVGGFVPLVLHLPAARAQLVADTRSAAATLSAGGARCFVTAVVSSHASWDRPALDADNWTTLFEGLSIVEEICTEFGLTQVVHPHVDTLIETAAEMDRFLGNSGVKFCLDTGHLFIGGADPVVLAGKFHDRVGLVHIKDVNGAVAQRLYADELTLVTATAAGLFPAAGTGEVPISATIAALEEAWYDGWYVLEQDVALTDGEPPPGEGPILEVRKSLEYLRSLVA